MLHFLLWYGFTGMKLLLRPSIYLSLRELEETFISIPSLPLLTSSIAVRSIMELIPLHDTGQYNYLSLRERKELR